MEKIHFLSGFALFSMFFGAGNLIFPLTVTIQAGDEIFSAFFGFLLSAVVLPGLGVWGLVRQGSKERFFETFGVLGLVLSWLIVFLWIPFGSGPRCIAVSYGAWIRMIYVPLWVYSLVYSALVYWCTVKPTRVLEVLGQILTPVLLLSLVIVGIFAAFEPAGAAIEGMGQGAFLLGVFEGYNTMDLMAGVFFTASVMGMLEAASRKNPRKDLAKAGVLGLGLLSAVYGILFYAAAKHKSILLGQGAEHMFPVLVEFLLGRAGGLVVVTVAVACFTTSVALTAVVAELLAKGWKKPLMSYERAVFFVSVFHGAVALVGYENLSKVIGLSMKGLYPILMGMVFFALVSKLPKKY